MHGVLGRVPTHDDAADKPVRILHRCQAVSMIVPQNTGTVECGRTGGKKTAAFGRKPGQQPFKKRYGNLNNQGSLVAKISNLKYVSR
jgi:hypothetical protein